MESPPANGAAAVAAKTPCTNEDLSSLLDNLNKRDFNFLLPISLRKPVESDLLEPLSLFVSNYHKSLQKKFLGLSSARKNIDLSESPSPQDENIISENNSGFDLAATRDNRIESPSTQTQNALAQCHASVNENLSSNARTDMQHNANSGSEEKPMPEKELPDPSDAHNGFLRLKNLRNQICSLSNLEESNAQESLLCKYLEYHAGLNECEERGFDFFSDLPALSLKWEVNLSFSKLVEERIYVLWNIAGLESYFATLDIFENSKQSLTKAINRFNLGASIFYHIRTELLPNIQDSSLSIPSQKLEGLEQLCLAQGQSCTYQMAFLGPLRPMPNVLAKIAMGASDVYGKAYVLSEGVEGESENERDSHHMKYKSMLYRARAEVHQSLYVQQKKGDMNEFHQRLEFALSYLEQALISAQTIEMNDLSELERFFLLIKTTLSSITKSNGKEIEEKSLIPIKGQLISKIISLGSNYSKLGNAGHPIFNKDLKSSKNEVVDKLIRESTAKARSLLADLNLPHSLIAYESNSSYDTRGGLSEDLWARIQSSQETDEIASLKQSIWDLRDMSEHIHSISQDIDKQLEEDMRLDEEFRSTYKNYDGPLASELQKGSVQTMKQSSALLKNASDGDEVLFKYLETFDSDPKFQLLNYDRKQLDQLTCSPPSSKKHDTSKLRSLLEKLELTLKERNSMRSENEETVKQNCIVQQNLLCEIVSENTLFNNAKSSSRIDEKDSLLLTKLEEAIHIINTASQQLSEGYNFYSLIKLKLIQLKTHVNNTSVRLAIQRYEYEDKEKIRQQEKEDEEMARKLSNMLSSSSGNDEDVGTVAHENNFPFTPSNSGSGNAVDGAEGGSSAYPSLSEFPSSPSIENNIIPGNEIPTSLDDNNNSENTRPFMHPDNNSNPNIPSIPTSIGPAPNPSGRISTDPPPAGAFSPPSFGNDFGPSNEGRGFRPIGNGKSAFSAPSQNGRSSNIQANNDNLNPSLFAGGTPHDSQPEKLSPTISNGDNNSGNSENELPSLNLGSTTSAAGSGAGDHNSGFSSIANNPMSAFTRPSSGTNSNDHLPSSLTGDLNGMKETDDNGCDGVARLNSFNHRDVPFPGAGEASESDVPPSYPSFNPSAFDSCHSNDKPDSTPSPPSPPTSTSLSASDTNYPDGNNRSGTNADSDEHTLHTRNTSSSGFSGGSPGDYQSPGSVRWQRNDRPNPTKVDDEKVASLVSMDFDPEKVVRALQKYDNNLDHALNDLLS